MFRNHARIATVFTLLAAAAVNVPGHAAAWPAADAKSGPSGPAAGSGQGFQSAGAQTAGAGPSSEKAAPPRKATKDQRIAAARQQPLVRAAFWQHELALDPGDVEAGVGLSSALRALGKLDEAADIADRMVSLAPKNIEALLESGRTHIEAGHGFYAIQPLRDAMKLAPRDWRAASLLGVALEQDERPADALAMYETALKLSPDNPAVLCNLALFHATRGEVPEAERLLRRAVAQPQASAKERQNLALLLGLEGKTIEAETWMRMDLPPEATRANLAYVSLAATAPAMAAGPPPGGASQRTWRSMESAQAAAKGATP